MSLITKKLTTYLPFIGLIFAHWLLGFATVNGLLPLGLLAIALIYWWFQQSYSLSLRNRLVSLYFANIILMNTLTWWFKDIDASGWTRIAGIAPQVWLLLAVFLATTLCCLPIVLLFYGFYKLYNPKNRSVFQTVYSTSFVLIVAEIIKSTMFSLVVKTGASPIEPSWNLYSIAQIAAHNNLSLIGRGLGMWGVVFALYFLGCCIALVALAIKNGKYKKRSFTNVFKREYPFLILLIVVLAASYFVLPGNDTKDISLVAVRQDKNEERYLEDLKSSLGPSRDIPQFVSLPEYSNFKHPFANTTLPISNYDARYTFPDTYRNSKTYFVATENEYIDKTKYVETYVTNGNLDKISREVKTLLIPGGEYVIGWVGSLITTFDKDATDTFMSARSRSVISSSTELPTSYDANADLIATGACSALLKPHHFRKQISAGAYAISTNVSFEQFTATNQYQKIADRHSRLIAKMTARPLAQGTRQGPAIIYNDRGQIVAQSDSERYVEHTFTANNDKTLYVLLGDTLILLLMATPVAFFVINQRTITKKSKK